MQISDRPLAVVNPTLNALITELGIECRNVTTLINQLQLPHLAPIQQAEILADLLAAITHLHVHCDQEMQNLVADELETLPDQDEA